MYILNESSPEWKKIHNHIKEKLEFKIEKDGEFWFETKINFILYLLNMHKMHIKKRMDFKDWILNFDDCFLCNLTPHIKFETANVSKSLSVKFLKIHFMFLIKFLN